MDTIETSIYTAVLICCFILGFVFLYFGITIIRKQRKHYEMQKAHFLAEIELLESERNRIARDLHDELGPLLSITKIEVSEIKIDKKESIELRRRAILHVDELTERLGGIARNLVSRQLLQKGLHAALEDFFKQYQEVTPIQLSYEYRVKRSIPVILRSQVYKMIREIVHNAGKHSNATVLNVLLLERKDLLYIYCKDDGIGIGDKASRPIRGDDRARDTGNGIGLESLKNRTEMLGGKLQYKSHKGTEYFIEIPLTD